MNNNNEILYIKQGNRESIIYYLDDKNKKEGVLTNLLNKWCLEELTTYKGRMEAIREKFHLRKYVPIYINEELMLMPTTTKNDIDIIYINIVNILKIEKNDNKSKIIFKNRKELILNVDYEKLNRFYCRCINIYQLIK